MPTEVLYSIIGALCLAIVGLLKIGNSSNRAYMDAGFARIEAALQGLLNKWEASTERQAKIERDCATWVALEKIADRVDAVDARVDDMKSRLAVVESVCSQRHERRQ